jgi:hypothetical protein
MARCDFLGIQKYVLVARDFGVVEVHGANGRGECGIA